MSQKKYRTVTGVVQFEPKEKEANGKTVRSLVVQQTGFGETAPRVYATLWPSHDHVKVNEGDVVVLDGSYTANKTTSDDGESRTFHNLSVNRIAVLGTTDSGQEPAVENATSSDDTDTDEIPF